MRARARVAVERAAGSGSTVVRELRSAPPLTLRATLDGVHLVGSGAGPVGGDDLHLDVSVGPGAELRFASVAASLAHPGPSGAPSRTATTVAVAAGGRLVGHLQPLVLVRGCDHRATTEVTVAEGAVLAWREQVVLGRHAEPSGSLRQRLDVAGPDGPLLRTELAVGERWPGVDGPAGLGSARSVGSLLVVAAAPVLAALVSAVEARWDGPRPTGAPGPGAAPPGVRTAALALDGPGVLVSAVGDSPAAVARALDGLVEDVLGPPVGAGGAGAPPEGRGTGPGPAPGLGRSGRARRRW